MIGIDKVTIAIISLVVLVIVFTTLIPFDDGVGCMVEQSPDAIYIITENDIVLYNGGVLPFPEDLKGIYREIGPCTFEWSLLDAGVKTYDDLLSFDQENIETEWWGDDYCIFGNGGVMYGYYYECV